MQKRTHFIALIQLFIHLIIQEYNVSLFHIWHNFLQILSNFTLVKINKFRMNIINKDKLLIIEITIFAAYDDDDDDDGLEDDDIGQ